MGVTKKTPTSTHQPINHTHIHTYTHTHIHTYTHTALGSPRKRARHLSAVMLSQQCHSHVESDGEYDAEGEYEGRNDFGLEVKNEFEADR